MCNKGEWWILVFECIKLKFSYVKIGVVIKVRVIVKVSIGFRVDLKNKIIVMLVNVCNNNYIFKLCLDCLIGSSLCDLFNVLV